MTKRPATSSPNGGRHEVKKQKLESSTVVPNLTVQAATVIPGLQPKHIVGDNIVDNETDENGTSKDGTIVAEENTPKGGPPTTQSLEETVEVKEAKSKPKRKAGEGFDPWTPPQAEDAIPEVQPHWGTIPRSDSYRPVEPQPSARESNAAVVPPLWEDRKGGVRLKRGSRFIKDYDQANHMHLRLMDLRPVSARIQAPRRKPVYYWYKHGMIRDWNDTGALNDTNKALREVMRTNSNREPAYSTDERQTLLRICSENPDASIWDIAVRFNDEFYPLNGTEGGQYPKGRFIESIVHEYRIYKSSYDKGEIPTDKTAKDIQLEKLYAASKAEKKADAKKTNTEERGAAKIPSAKMSDTSGVTKKKRAPRKKKLTPKDMAAQVARADAIYQEIVRKDAAEAATKAAAEGTASRPAEPTVPISEQARLSDDNEEMLELGGAYNTGDVRPSSPLTVLALAIAASRSYGVQATVDLWHKLHATQTASGGNEQSNAPSGQAKDSVEPQQRLNVVAETQFAPSVKPDAIEFRVIKWTGKTSQDTQAEVAAGSHEPVADAQVPTASSMVNSTFVEKAVREVQIDENYDDDDEFM